jgi:hypothetical protein
MAKNHIDLRLEVQLDLDNLSHEISGKLNVEQICSFVQEVVEGYADLGLDEELFLSQLKNMISQIESCPEDYAGTKWEMLLAMQGLLDK